MSTNLKDELFALPVEERIQLVEELWDSVARDAGAVPTTDAQKRELDRRLAAYDADPRAGIDWAELKARLLDR